LTTTTNAVPAPGKQGLGISHGKELQEKIRKGESGQKRPVILWPEIAGFEDAIVAVERIFAKFHVPFAAIVHPRHKNHVNSLFRGFRLSSDVNN
jgi:hypothetical protein